MFYRPTKIIVFLSALLLSINSFSADTNTTSTSVLNTAPSLQTQNRSGLEQELNQLIEIYTFQPFASKHKNKRRRQIRQEKKRQIITTKTLIFYSGVSDIRLFDIVEKNLLANYQYDKKRKSRQYTAWMLKMLAYSGQNKYKATIEKIISGKVKKLTKKHGMTALSELPKYKRWNLLISQNLHDLPADKLTNARLTNILNSDDPELIRLGAKAIIQTQLANTILTDLAEKRLLKIYQTPVTQDQGREFEDASSWLCKVLGYGQNTKYKATLEKIVKTANSPKISRWASTSLAEMFVSSSSTNRPLNRRR